MPRYVTYDENYIRERTALDEKGCWIWLGATNSDGYGSVNRNSCGEYSTHRLSYKIFKGRIPTGMLVRHTCDDTMCCNPNHLKLGSQADNVDDAFGRGRRTNDSLLKAADAKRIPQHIVEAITIMYAEGAHWTKISKTLKISRSVIYKHTTQQRAINHG